MSSWPLAVLFDFDGVIVNSEPVHLRAFQTAAASEGIDLTAEQYYRELIGRDDAGAWRVVFQLHGRPLDDATLARVMDTKFREMQHLLARREIEPFNGVVDLIKHLHSQGRPLAICSAAIRAEVTAMLSGLGVSQFFSVVTCAEDVVRGKPDPSGYLLTLNRLSEMIGHALEPGDALVIEDAPAVLQSVRKVGFKSLGVATSYPLEALSAANWAVRSLDRDQLRGVRDLAVLYDGGA